MNYGLQQKKVFLTLCFIAVSITMVHAQEQRLYQYKTFVQNQDTLQYRILYPNNFSEEKEYPLVLFLHGAGERGSNNESQLTHGSSLFSTEKNREAFPAIVVFPQCPKEQYWSNAEIDRSTRPIGFTFPLNQPATKALSLVEQLTTTLLEKPYVNTSQVYLGGLSMGGMGTFELLYRNPNTYAAAFAICGAGNPEATLNYAKTTPIWVFHGANDDVVDPLFSVLMVKAILENGGKPNFTLYQKDNHNSWDSAFSEPELLPWLFSTIK